MKILKIIGEALPVVAMIALIPFVTNDYLLALIYLAGSIALILIRKMNGGILFFLFGFVALTISEAFFISTGVEIFSRRTLFGMMPIWLPVLWGYAFVAIKRSIEILNKN